MIKKTAIATTFTLMALAGPATAFAGEGAPAPISPADQCVWNYFNDTAANFKGMPGEYTLTYEIDQLAGIAQSCEKDTGTEARFFNGIKDFTTTVGNVTLTFGKK